MTREEREKRNAKRTAAMYGAWCSWTFLPWFTTFATGGFDGVHILIPLTLILGMMVLTINPVTHIIIFFTS